MGGNGSISFVDLRAEIFVFSVVYWSLCLRRRVHVGVCVVVDRTSGTLFIYADDFCENLAPTPLLYRGGIVYGGLNERPCSARLRVAAQLSHKFSIIH